MTSIPHFTNRALEHVRVNMKNTKHLSRVLQRCSLQRQVFNPERAEHRAAYLIFMRTGKWVLHFYGELPYQSVVSMVQDKLLKHFLETELTERTVTKILTTLETAHSRTQVEKILQLHAA